MRRFLFPNGAKNIVGDQDISFETGIESGIIRIEIESALRRDILVSPLLARDAKMPADSELSDVIEELSLRDGIPVYPDPDFHNDIGRLMDGLEDILK